MTLDRLDEGPTPSRLLRAVVPPVAARITAIGETQPGPQLSLPPSYERDIDIGL